MSLSAVYDVTRALRMLLYSQLLRVSASAVVTLLPPGDDLPEASGVNLYLYRVVESPSTKNRDWPGDRVTGPATVPALGLELSYLLTPLGKAPDNGSPDLGDDAHTMLGVAMSALARYPVLNDVHLPDFDADAVLSAALQQSFQRVRVTLLPTDLDSLSKIWSTINKPYRLSVAYEVSLVEVVPADPLPNDDGPAVLSTGLTVHPFTTPVIDALVPAAGAVAAVSGGALVAQTLTVAGSGLTWRATAPAVLFGGTSLALAAAPPPSPNALAVTLPLDPPAGPQVDVRVQAGALTSPALAFVVTPWLASSVPLRSALDGAAATLVLSGSGFGPAGARVRLDGVATVDAGPLAAGATDASGSIALPGTLANGAYTVRVVRTDGTATNGRPLSVIPLLATAAATVIHPGAVDVHRLDLSGARLNGTSVHVVVDGVDYAAPANASATALSYTFARKLDPGPHAVQVTVDGAASHEIGFSA